MRPLEHHELRDVARAVTDELDDHVDVAVEEASLGLGQERQRGAAPGCAASCPPSTLMVIVRPAN